MRLLVCLLFALPLAAQTVTVTGTSLTDATGTPLNGTIHFQPQGPMQVSGLGQISATPVSATVTAGHFSITIADTNKALPAGSCYNVWVSDSRNVTVMGSFFFLGMANGPYTCVRVASSWCFNGACNFDTYVPYSSGSGGSILASIPFITTFTFGTVIGAGTHNEGTTPVAAFFMPDGYAGSMEYARNGAGDITPYGTPSGTAEIAFGAGNFSQSEMSAGSISITAATHGQGAYALPFCFDAAGYSATCGNWTRDGSGNFAFAFSPAFTGVVQILSPFGTPYTQSLSGATSITVSVSTHAMGALAEVALFTPSGTSVAASYLRDSFGNMTLSFSPAFTGTLEIYQLK